MRILVVQESDWIARGPHQSHHLMERLSKRGHEIRVIDYEIMWRQQGKKELISERQIFEGVHKAIDDGEVTVIRPSIVKFPALDYVSLIYTHQKEIKKQIEEFRPDVIIGFGILNANIAIKHAKKNGIPFIYYIIDELHRLVPEKAFREIAKFIESYNIKNADRVISINEGLREYTIQMGAEKEKTTVIRAGVDPDRFTSDGREAIRKRYGINDKDIVLFFMGWLYNFSGIKEVALELANCKNNIKLLVIGKGDLWVTLQDIKYKYALNGKLIIIDWVNYSDVPKYLAAADICILPAHKDNIMKNIVPIKMYEYMAAGKPIIATDIYGIRKEFGEDNGVTYINKPQDLLKLDILDYYTKRAHIDGDRARKFAARLSWEDNTKIFEKCIEDLTNNNACT